MPELSKRASVKAGDVIEGRYRIIRTVEEGGMGTVFLAEHVMIKRRLAVKILHSELATDTEVIERFMNEARAAGTLGHPHIVESTDMGFTRDDIPYIVFEYLEGTLLTDEIYRTGGLSARRALKIAEQIASALLAAHNANIVHRDLKSDNVYLTDKDDAPDHVKVLDFGISRFMDDGIAGIAGTGMVMGTPEYMAPEQVTHPDSVDHRADIYALGVILYEMLAARVPFSTDGDRKALVERIVHEVPPPLARADLPPGLQEMILTKLIAKDPAKRYQSMKLVQGALEAFRSVTRPTMPALPRAKTSTEAGQRKAAAAAAVVAAVPADPARLAPSTPTRRRARLGALVAAVVAGGVGFGLMAAERPPAPTTTDRASRDALKADAEQIARAVESAVNAARLRTDGIATSPMLRAAVETDAATLRDMSKGDLVFTVNPGEVLEVFQTRDQKTTSLLRLPAAAPAIELGSGIKARVAAEKGGTIAVTVVSPIAGYQPSISGSIALVVPVDLSSLQARIGDRVLRASVVGLAEPVVLARGDSPPGTVIAVPIVMSPDLEVPPLSLAAEIPVQAPPGRDPLVIVRYASWGVAGLLLVIYLGSLLSSRTRG
jgi:tRNA A-37 threonylcarbamoyl transferase component Bud32